MHTKFWSENLNERGHMGIFKFSLKDNIKMDFKEPLCEGAGWIRLAPYGGLWPAL